MSERYLRVWGLSEQGLRCLVPKLQLEVHSKVSCLALCQKNELESYLGLATESGDLCVFLWRIDKIDPEEEVIFLEIVRRYFPVMVTSISFLPYHNILATGDQDGAVQILSLEDGTNKMEPLRVDSEVRDLIFSTDEKEAPQSINLLIATAKGSIFVVRLTPGAWTSETVRVFENAPRDYGELLQTFVITNRNILTSTSSIVHHFVSNPESLLKMNRTSAVAEDVKTLTGLMESKPKPSPFYDSQVQVLPSPPPRQSQGQTISRASFPSPSVSDRTASSTVTSTVTVTGTSPLPVAMPVAGNVDVAEEGLGQTLHAEFVVMMFQRGILVVRVPYRIIVSRFSFRNTSIVYSSIIQHKGNELIGTIDKTGTGRLLQLIDLALLKEVKVAAEDEAAPLFPQEFLTSSNLLSSSGQLVQSSGLSFLLTPTLPSVTPPPPPERSKQAPDSPAKVTTKPETSLSASISNFVQQFRDTNFDEIFLDEVVSASAPPTSNRSSTSTREGPQSKMVQMGQENLDRANERAQKLDKLKQDLNELHDASQDYRKAMEALAQKNSKNS
eukprot:TRINITY_DN5306_c0_g1_i2.p1 TRINITY_DN5306_c0_g1~~TRINITY_DN5306_c0_g1_i2.p1  ORF type:complete len:556 (+),score=129.75 TRINITY_DN5306_c0_g1_i2:534-2201(+)